MTTDESFFGTCPTCGTAGEEFDGMVKVFTHQAAGYKVYIRAEGEDGSGGYYLETERRNGEYVECRGRTMPEACRLLAEMLK